MSSVLIGRTEEQAILHHALASGEPELVAVLGRRRVGKTFLVKQVYSKEIIFEIVGLQHAKRKEQLQNFRQQLTLFSKSSLPIQAPSNWLEAFFMLANFLENTMGSAEKKVIFFDEVPWMANQKSGFLTGLGWFWNSWAVNKNIVIVICGSAASWMIQKVVNDRGGLHNRITRRVFLKPFTLSETEAYLHSRNIPFNRYQIAQLYMAIGGIPHYLKEVIGGKSAAQNINDICFSPNGFLRDEFSRLYPSLFANAEGHVQVVRALAHSRQGLSRNEILKHAKLPNGGSSTRLFEELEQSGFITSYYAFGKKKKDLLYRLTDEYSLFFIRFIEKAKEEGNDLWNHLSQTQSAKTWAGYAFENICLKHILQIKKALGISGIYAAASSFMQRSGEDGEGAQIDLVFDRNDQIINLFEIKFYASEYQMSKEEAQALQDKVRIFQQATQTNKHIMPIVLTTFGLKHNQHSLGLVAKALSLDDLFL